MNMYISYGSTDPSIVRYFSNRVPRSVATTSAQFVIDSATVAAWSLTSPSSSRPATYGDASSTLNDLREAVTTLEETERTARRVFGGAHPLVVQIERGLQAARAALREATRQPT